MSPKHQERRFEPEYAATLVKIAVPMVHDPGVLLAKLPADRQPDVGYEISKLNDYAGVRR